MASNEESPEALAFQEHYSELVKGLLDPQSVAEKLFSKRLISIQKLQEIEGFDRTTMEKSRILLQAVRNAIIFQNPAVFHLFIDALEEERCSGSLASKLRLSFDHFRACCQVEHFVTGASVSVQGAGPSIENAQSSKRGRSDDAHSPETLQLAGTARKKMRSDEGAVSYPGEPVRPSSVSNSETCYPAEPVVPPRQPSVSNITIYGSAQIQGDVHQVQHGPGTMHGGGMQQQQNGAGTQQDHPDTSFHTLCTVVKKAYSRGPEVRYDCWPPVRQSSFVNVALLNNDKCWYVDDFSRETVQRSADDIHEKKRNISFEELFTAVQPGARILIEGRPGSGKTTLMNKVSREWAKGTILKEVKLLLHMPLRRFYNKKSLDLRDFIKLIDPEGFHDSAHLRRVLSTGEGVCVVLDGIDEYRHAHEPDNLIRELLQCHRLPDAIVIAASRPAATQCFREFATKRAEVLGFLRHQIAQYIKVHYENHEDRAAGLLTYLQGHQNIHRMCYLPLHLAMVVYLNDTLGGHCENMPTTETEVYQRFTTYTLLRDEQRESVSLENLATPEDLRPEKLLVFRKICALAYQQTLNLRPIFSKKDILESLQEEISLESLGLLTADKQYTELGVEETFSFLHLTFQEFLSAYYIANLEGQQSLDHFKECGELPHMRVSWKFFCGISTLERDHEKELFCLMAKLQCEQNTVHLIQCAYESQNKDSPKLLVSATDGLICIQDESMLPTDCLALSFVVNNCGEELHKLELSSCQLDVEEFRVLLETINNSPGLKSLCFKRTPIKKDALPMLTKLLEKFPNLEELEVTKCLRRLQKVKDLLPKMKRLTSLRVDASVGVELAENVFDAYPTLQTFRIVGISLDAEFSMTHEKAITGRLFHITEKKEHLASTYDSDNRLRIKLKRKNCKQPDIEVFRVFSSWCTVSHLNLKYNSIGPEGAATLSTALQFMTSLQELDLNDNIVGDEGLRSLSGTLARCTQLQELHLWSNELTDESVECLTHLLNSLKDLNYLDVSYNYFSEDGKRKLMQAAEAREGTPNFTKTTLNVSNQYYTGSVVD